MAVTGKENRTEKSIPTFRASFTIGLQRGYSHKQYSKSEFIKELQAYQNQFIKEKSVYLSACISDCDIVLSNQIEPHIKLEFINYPRFEMSTIALKEEITKLAYHLMDRFSQNRIVIVFNDETRMIEISPEVDPRIIGQ